MIIDGQIFTSGVVMLAAILSGRDHTMALLRVATAIREMLSRSEAASCIECVTTSTLSLHANTRSDAER